MKFRKKPVVIEAVQWDGTTQKWGEIYQFCTADDGVSVLTGPHPIGDETPLLRASITTREGTMFAEPGDWIIRGVKGEFYPCKPDIFAATYDPVSE